MSLIFASERMVYILLPPPCQLYSVASTHWGHVAFCFFQVPFWKSYYTLEILLRLVLFSCQKKKPSYFVTLFINQFHSPVCRYAARASVCSCCGCRLWGTTVLKSSSLFLPVWYQDFLLCPPLEGSVPSTPSFITLSPLPLMVDIITFFRNL